MNENIDWLDLVIHNPEKSNEDLALAGITESSLTLKEADYYKDIPEIKQMFTDSNGTFNESNFDKFYKNVSKMYSNYVMQDQELQAFAKDYDLDDMRKRNRLTGEVYLKKVANPTQYKQGLSGIFRTTEGSLSRREAMQNAEVRDWRTGKSLGYTPNDDDKRGLFDFLGLEPLVEAVWEEDGTHIDPFTNQTVEHKKGEHKIDEDGNFYYETLGGRDASGKSFLKQWDTLTVDGTFWNKFDPFDSDGVSKSIGGQIAKTAAIMAPLLIPGVNTAYGYLMAGVLLSDALSTFGKAGTEMLDPNYTNNRLWNAFNMYGAFMRRFDSSASDENGYFEQGTNMLSSVASQLFQQRAIAQIPKFLKWNKSDTKILKDFINEHGDSYLKKYGKNISKALADGDISATSLLSEKRLLDNYNSMMQLNKRASDASKLYMVVTQSQGVYDTFKENGFDETTTAIGLLGTAYGFNKLFNTSLGEIALSGLGLDELGAAVKPVTKKLAGEMSEGLGKLASEVAEEKSKSVTYNAIRKYGSEFAKKFKDIITGPNTLKADMLKESIEETSEEFLQDAALISASAINSALEKLGLHESSDTYNYFNTNPLERYLMSAAGGAMGSAVFTGIRKWESLISGNSAVSELPKEDLSNLIKIVSNNPVSAIKKIIENTDYGSKTLSAQLETAPDGTTYFKKANSYEDSQDAIMKKTMLSIVDSIDNAINSEIGKVDKNNILNTALGRDFRARELANQSYSILQNIATDFNNIVTSLVQAKAKISSTKDGESPSKTDMDAYNEAKSEYERLINGERAADYVEKMAFLLNRGVSGAFKNDLDIYTFAMSRGKNYATMSPEEQEELNNLYKVKISNDANKEDTAFNTFKFFRDKVLSDIQNISLQSENLQNRKVYQDSLDKIQEDLIKTYLPKEKIEAFKSALESARDANLDAFIESNNLDKNNELETEEQKRIAADLFIQDELINWTESELNKVGALTSNVSLGVDTTLLAAPESTLLRYSELLSNIIASNSTIDSEVVDKLKRTFDYFNKFNFNDYSGTILERIKLELESGQTLTLDSFKSPTILEKFPQFNDGSGIVDITKNPDGTYNLMDEDAEEPIEEIGVQLSDLDLKSIINDVFSGSVDSSTKIIGGLLPDNDYQGYNSKSGSMSKIIEEVLMSSLELNPNISILQEVASSLNQVKEKTVSDSPLRKMLETLSKELTGENVFSIINEEEKVFGSLNNLADYSIKNRITEGQLRAALGVISMAKSILKYSEGDNESEFGSMIDIVNNARKKSNLPEIPIVDSNAAIIWMKDLNRLSGDISYLLDLSSNNTVSKLKESSISLARNEANIIYALSDTEENKSIFGGVLEVNGNPFFDFKFTDSEQFFSNLSKNNFKDADDENTLARIDSIFTEMQEYYYNKFNNLSAEAKNELIDSIASIKGNGKVGLDYLKNFETKINRNSTIDDMSPEFIGNFLMSIFSINQKDLKKRFLKVLDGDNVYAPFFGQYLSISMAMAMEENPDLINKFIDRKSELNERELGNILFKNITIINGDPGSGKTTSVAYFIKQLIKEKNPDAKIIAAAPNSDQADKLSSLLDEAKGYSKSDLFNEVLTNKGKEFYDKITASYGNRTYGNGLILNPIPNINELVHQYKEPVYVFIDEYTHFSSYEMDLLTKIPNLRIVGLGDTKQEGFKVDGSPNYVSGIVYSAPSLMMSVRAANGHKQDNLSILSTILRTSLEDINNSRLAKINVNLSDRYQILSKETYLKYYEGNNKLQGDKTVNSISEPEIRNLISSLGEKEKITLITNKSKSSTLDLFQRLIEEFPDKINIKQADDVQGSEFKYVVVDVKYDKVRGSNDTQINDSFLGTLRAFYTHITRSSDGSIIIMEGNNVPIAGSIRMGYSSDSGLQQSDINNYKEVISSIYKRSTNSNTETINSDLEKMEANEPDKPKNITAIEKNLVEREKEVTKEDDTPEFKKENLAIYFSSKHIGLSRTGENTFTPNSSREDLNLVLTSPMSKDEIISTPEYKAWSIMKRFSYAEDKENFLRQLKEGTNYINVFSKFTELLTGDRNNFLGMMDILEKGQLKLKISKLNADTDYQLNNLNYNRTSKNFSRIVLQLTGLDGQTYDITVADISEDSNIGNSEFKKLINGDYPNPKYLNLNFDNIQVRGLISSSETNEYGLTLEKLQSLNPELTISNIYFESEGSFKGTPYVLVSDTPGITESEMLNSYGSEIFDIQKRKVSIIPYSYNDFFSQLNTLLESSKNHKTDYFKLRKFVPTALAPRLIASMYKLQYLLENENALNEYNKSIEEYNKEAEEFNKEADKIGGTYRKIIKKPLESTKENNRLLRSILALFAEKIPAESKEMVISEASLTNYQRAINKADIPALDQLLDEISIPKFNDLEIKFINKFKDRKLITLFKELSNPESSLYKDSNLISPNPNITGEQALSEKAQTMFESLSKISDTFSGRTLESVSDLFSSNLLFYTIKDLKLVEFFSKLEGEKQDLFRTSLEASGLFDNGILTQGRDVEAKYIEGYIKAAATKDKVYMYRQVLPRRAFIPYSSIEVNSNTNELNTDIQELYSKKLDELKANIDPELISQFNEITSKFQIEQSWTNDVLNENLNTYINNNYQRIKKLVWDSSPKLVSLQWKNNQLSSIRTDLNKNFLLNSSINPDILNSLADDNLNFVYQDDSIMIKSENGGIAIKINLDKTGNIRLSKTILSETNATVPITDSTKNITTSDLDKLLQKSFKTTITEDVSNLILTVNSTPNINDKVELLTEYIRKITDKKVGPKGKRAIENLFNKDNKSKC